MVDDATALPHDAVLLAGGRASRLGGVDKTALVTGGTTLFDHALAAADGATHVVVVGLRHGRAAPDHVIRAREDPPFAGPVAALDAGLGALPGSAPFTLVLACDLVRPQQAAAALLAAPERHAPHDGLIAVDQAGRRQPLLALYRTAALRDALDRLRATSGTLEDLSMRRLLAALDLVEVVLPSVLCADIDSAEDADRLLD
ncbi:molybdenum cofactor guanylyltransferase [Curtobacterium sp. VKM Ac-2922]|uniref:molybdenum cofactor guanylyltransferase n=1 Tax=Curtobacterium sp. VKM Ac-2922 TaxID=2929475 RepID=UPI001FB44304|nr:NTP transferase domain-containing protein [Curtobacterium sp. VKM Ac-2922]MCJ1715819.1 NTP transferase domain-containing protein [Curtobacterium sp. VKM Ac-2922]